MQTRLGERIAVFADFTEYRQIAEARLRNALCVWSGAVTCYHMTNVNDVVTARVLSYHCAHLTRRECSACVPGGTSCIVSAVSILLAGTNKHSVCIMLAGVSLY